MEIYYISAYTYNGAIHTCSVYIMGEDNTRRACQEMIDSGYDRVNVWRAHFTPDGVLTYGGTREMIYRKEEA